MFAARSWLAGPLWASFLAVSSLARAEDTDRAEPASLGPHAFGSHFGVEHLGALLHSAESNDRVRGLERLAGLGTDAAFDRLSSFALERRAQLGAREWLTLARVLAERVSHPKSQLALATLVSHEPRDESGPEEVLLLDLARATAALVLAEDGTAPSLQVLGRALRTGGQSAALAAHALEAHPPRQLGALLDVPGEPSVELAHLLGVLGDQRAFHHLRAWVRGASAEVRAAAAIALTELGHMETVPLARQWLAHDVPVLRQAALRILLLAQAPEAAPALARQLSAGDVGAELQRQALEFPTPALLEVALARSSGGGPGAASWWTLLGRIGGRQAAEKLEAGLALQDHAFAAAHALSRWAGSEAHEVLARALERQLALPLTVRAAAARARLWQERFPALPGRLATLQHSDVPSERAAGAWGLSLAGGRAALAELESGDAVRILAAANNALVFDDSVLEGAAALLSKAEAGPIRTALAVALIRPSGQRRVPSTLLRELVAEGGAARPLALRVLASRDEPEIGPLVGRYLNHPDPLLRAHVARGLGDNLLPSAIGLLSGRYEFETDASVRQAIVCALSSRRGLSAVRTLSLAARLDPSPGVRSAARLARAGVRLSDPPAGSDILWAELRPVPGSVATHESDVTARNRTERGGAILNVAPGLAFPVFADATGLLVVAGVGVNHLGIRLQ